jgi:phosphomevalonate kinase
LTGNVAGVAGGVVPGAGGYDALALLVKDDKETMDDLKAFLVQWSAERRGNVKLLSAKGELEGARERSASVYSGFG